MTSMWLTIVGEGAVLFGIAAGITAWVRSRLVTSTEPSGTPEV